MSIAIVNKTWEEKNGIIAKIEMNWFGIESRNVPKKETVQKIAHLS